MFLSNLSKITIGVFLIFGLYACGGDSSASTKAKAASTETTAAKSPAPAAKPAAPKKVIISGKDMTVKSGEEFCTDVQVTNFLDVISMQYSTNFDDKALEFVELKNPSLKDLNIKLNATNFSRVKGQENTIRFSWFTQDLQGVSLYDGSTIYQICFKAIGKSGTETKIDFAEKPMAGEIGNSKLQPMPAEFGEAKITIE